MIDELKSNLNFLLRRSFIRLSILKFCSLVLLKLLVTSASSTHTQLAPTPHSNTSLLHHASLPPPNLLPPGSQNLPITHLPPGSSNTHSPPPHIKEQHSKKRVGHLLLGPGNASSTPEIPAGENPLLESVSAL